MKASSPNNKEAKKNKPSHGIQDHYSRAYSRNSQDVPITLPLRLDRLRKSINDTHDDHALLLASFNFFFLQWKVQ